MSRMNLGIELTKLWSSDNERAYRYVWQCFFTGLAALATLVAFPVALLTARRWARWQLVRAHAISRADEAPVLTANPRRRIGWLAFHAVVGTVLGAIGTVGWGYVASMTIALIMSSLNGDPSDTPLLAKLLLGPITEPWQLTLLTAVALGLSLAVPALLVPPLARFHANRTLALLGPTRDELGERVEVLTATRSNAVDAHSAELRRIERDLHDGTQAQLVALSMRLGLAEERVADDPETATLLRQARTGAEDAMTELRGVVRTMYPPILADRGLEGAVAGLAARSAIPTGITARNLGDLPAPVEAAAYFIVAEALTNAAKHSVATRIRVILDRDARGLHVHVTDDGIGGVEGADESQGTGLVGIRRRVAALDGTTTIRSPVGGPTTIAVELPCGS